MKDFQRGSEWRMWDLHVHTKSSFDYKYKSDDADEKLVGAWRDKNLSAIAITDHFLIDHEKIEKLRELAPEITIFPGVELRTDKGAANIHVIIIFSNDVNVKDLSMSFHYDLYKKAKAKENNETIYWDYNDICTFANENNGILSIHTGSKSSGLDKEISNALPVNMAIKQEFAENVSIFEVGKIEDEKIYKDMVFKKIKKRPVIMCSDNHDPRDYKIKEKLWIKSDLTFNGLKQAIQHPSERVYLGEMPPKLQNINKNKRVYIDKIKIEKYEEVKGDSSEWFNEEVILNPGLVTIIGNKGSGKSALSDIIGRMTSCSTMAHASFLNSNRFLTSSKNFGDKYFVQGTWFDGKETEKISLDQSGDISIHYAQYLPQKYIETVCTDLGNEFQKEINKVIYSYVDDTEKVDSSSFNEFIEYKSKQLNYQIEELKSEIEKKNEEIILLENEYDEEYQKDLKENLEKIIEDIKRHEALKPVTIEKSSVTHEQESELQKKISQKDAELFSLEEEERKVKKDLKEENFKLGKISEITTKIQSFTRQIDLMNKEIKSEIEDSNLKERFVPLTYESPLHYYEEIAAEASKRKDILLFKISKNNKDNLLDKILKVKQDREQLIEQGSEEEKKYQSYLVELDEWNKQLKKLQGGKNEEGSLTYFEEKLNYIQSSLDQDYTKLTNDREKIMIEIYRNKQKISNVFKEIYRPIDEELTAILMTIEDKISFTSEVNLIDEEFGHKILSEINKNFTGIFNGKEDSIKTLNEILKKTNFDEEDSVMEMIKKILKVITDDISKSKKLVRNKKRFLDYLTSLSYLNVEYKLMMRDRSLNELSPGERGLVLLVFYLTLDKKEIPIIIDQPEDNLDNQSVYDKLVPCILEARKRRQVIIVTHNPNIAIACDSDQIISCSIDKTNNKISYNSGSIENVEFTDKILEILEGTMPAFNLRKEKYHIASNIVV